jgi:hypothetical protein
VLDHPYWPVFCILNYLPRRRASLCKRCGIRAPQTKLRGPVCVARPGNGQLLAHWKVTGLHWAVHKRRSLLREPTHSTRLLPDGRWNNWHILDLCSFLPFYWRECALWHFFWCHLLDYVKDGSCRDSRGSWWIWKRTESYSWSADLECPSCIRNDHGSRLLGTRDFLVHVRTI